MKTHSLLIRNKMLADSSSSINKSVPDNQSFDKKHSSTTLLPRSAWNNNLAFLRIVFKVKKALDEMEFTKDMKY